MHLDRFAFKYEDVEIYYKIKNYIEKGNREGCLCWVFFFSCKAYWTLENSQNISIKSKH